MDFSFNEKFFAEEKNENSTQKKHEFKLNLLDEKVFEQLDIQTAGIFFASLF